MKGLAADLRAAQEAKLAKLQQQLEHQQEDAKTKELEIKMSLKYKKAKFFGGVQPASAAVAHLAFTERKKITRTLAKLAKRLAKDGPSEELTAKQMSAQRDLLYVTVSVALLV